MHRTPTLTTEGRAPSYLALALYLLNEWVRELLEATPERYIDDTVPTGWSSGPTVQWVVPQRTAAGVRSAIVALPVESAARECEADAQIAAQRAGAATLWRGTRYALTQQLLQRVRSAQPRGWGWVFWSAPAALQAWALHEVQTVRPVDVQDRAWHRIWVFLTLRSAALAELEQAELDADLRHALHCMGMINAPDEIDHRRD